MGYKSYKDDVEKAMKKGEKDALITVGMFLQGAASLLSKVDTGRLRASITYVVEDETGRVKSDNTGKVHIKDNPHGKGPKNTLVYGTNVEYAPAQEKKNPFLKPALVNNRSEINRIINKAVREALK